MEVGTRQRAKNEGKFENAPMKNLPLQTFSVTQFNRILKHEYRRLENPAYTVANYLNRITRVGTDQILKDIKYNIPEDQQLDRPDRVIAYIDRKTGTIHVRPAIITQIGHLGYLEETLRGRTSTVYNGGHLLGLSFYNDWPKINDPSNIAPQREDDNQQRGNWRNAERKIEKKEKIVIEAAVNYPDRTYTIWPSRAMDVIKNGSDTANRYSKLNWYEKVRLPQLVHTWVPSQYHMSVTSVDYSSSPVSDTAIAIDLTNWFPLVHRISSPVKGLLTRIVPHMNLFERFNSRFFMGGIDVRSQGSHPYGDSLNEIKQIVIDLTKLTALVFKAKQISYISSNWSKIPGITTFIRTLPLELSTRLSYSPVAALLIYAVTHQLNITRIIPEYPGLKQLKYFLGILGI